MDWALIGQYGLPIALVIFFVIQGRDREKRMADRIDKQDDYVQDLQATVIKDNTQAMNRMADSHHDTQLILKELAENTGKLYCLQKPWDGHERRQPNRGA